MPGKRMTAKRTIGEVDIGEKEKKRKGGLKEGGNV